MIFDSFCKKIAEVPSRKYADHCTFILFPTNHMKEQRQQQQGQTDRGMNQGDQSTNPNRGNQQGQQSGSTMDPGRSSDTNADRGGNR